MKVKVEEVIDYWVRLRKLFLKQLENEKTILVECICIQQLMFLILQSRL